MRTTWDYTHLADAYLKRPEYATSALDQLFELVGGREGTQVCDVGAGTAHLTLELVKRGCRVTAVEPNDAMRAHGIQRTKDFDVQWFEGVGEATGQPAETFDLVTFGSSFNVTDRPKALQESARILKPRGWFACMWNHRDLSDPVQASIENVIKQMLPSYDYGTRREDQTEIIEASPDFGPVTHLQGDVVWEQSRGDCLEAWRSHGTLHRQAGEKFLAIIDGIERVLSALETDVLHIRYITNIWAAQRSR